MSTSTYSKWEFLSKTANLSFILGISIVFLSLLQWSLGAFEQIERFALFYLFSLTAPLTGLLYFLKREMEFSGKLVEKKIHRVILVLTVAYFSIILGVICYEPFASLSRMSYRTTTLAILLPIEILLIVLYRALFLKQRFHIIPNREEIKEYLSIFDGWYNKEDNPHQTLIESLIESLSKDEKDEVLNQLFTHFKTHNPRKMEKIILLRNRLNFLQKQIQDGIVSFEEIKKESSLITAAILDIIKSIR